MRTVAVLCVAPRSVYKGLPDVECYDRDRDALTFRGDKPVVAHAPCRAWSAHCRHQAKPLPGEIELGLFCAGMVKRCGGILEQPAHSLLWDAARLPLPGWTARAGMWSAEVWQCWWGYPMRKATWLLFSGISPNDVHYPLKLHPRGEDRRREQLMSHAERSATSEAFARWLVELARLSKVQ